MRVRVTSAQSSRFSGLFTAGRPLKSPLNGANYDDRNPPKAKVTRSNRVGCASKTGHFLTWTLGDSPAGKHRVSSAKKLAAIGGVLMGILLAFAPFILFAVLDRLIGPIEGLWAGAATSAVLLARDWLSKDRKPKILEIGTFVLFAGLAAYATAGGNVGSTVWGVRLLVDLGLLLIVLLSMALRQPFTLQYAREQVAQELWASPAFVRTNYVITSAWALAFVVLILADLILVFEPSIPPRVGIIATVVALIAAVKFTAWYPERAKRA